MYNFTVDQLFIAGKTSWRETPEYNFYDAGHEFRLFLKNPTKKEIESFKRGPIEIGFLFQDNVIFFLYRFFNFETGKEELSGEAPFSVHLVPNERKIIPDNIEASALFHCYLVEANTGILKAARFFSLDKTIANLQHKNIREQSQTAFSAQEHSNAINKAFCCTTDQLFDKCFATYKINGEKQH